MIDSEYPNPAELLFTEGKQFDWKQNESPAAATLARANFQQAAKMGHIAAARALAHMVYEGRGGSADKVQGLLILWSAFRKGDFEALEEISDLLASFSENTTEGHLNTRSAQISESLETAVDTLKKVNNFMLELALEKGSTKI